MKINNKKGISLIVLVITIIVIIILAAAVILSLANNNPIENAKEAQIANQNATREETASAAYAYWYLQKQIGNIDETPKEYISSVLQAQKFSDEEISQVIIINDKLYFVENPVVPDGFVASQATGETSVANGFVIYQGDEPVNDSNVINARKTRNQFVWIPVPEGTFVRDEGYVNGHLEDNKLSKTVEPYTGNAEEVAEYNAMKQSVEKYGGFYIGRYETSKNNEDNAQIVKGVSPWKDIAWGKSWDEPGAGGAVVKARAVCPVAAATEEGDPVSTLVYGVQWDSIIRFIESDYPGIRVDSTKYGNFKNATFKYTNTSGGTSTKSLNSTTVIPTGSAEYTNTNNMYDLAGNVWSYSMELKKDSSSRCFRGTSSISAGNVSPISYRGWGPASSGSVNIGFRVALYIK